MVTCRAPRSHRRATRQVARLLVEDLRARRAEGPVYPFSPTKLGHWSRAAGFARSDEQVTTRPRAQSSNTLVSRLMPKRRPPCPLRPGDPITSGNNATLTVITG